MLWTHTLNGFLMFPDNGGSQSIGRRICNREAKRLKAETRTPEAWLLLIIGWIIIHHWQIHQRNANGWWGWPWQPNFFNNSGSEMHMILSYCCLCLTAEVSGNAAMPSVACLCVKYWPLWVFVFCPAACYQNHFVFFSITGHLHVSCDVNFNLVFFKENYMKSWLQFTIVSLEQTCQSHEFYDRQQFIYIHLCKDKKF